MTERDEFDEIAIRTEAETAPSAALSASDQQADRRLLARDIAFAFRQHAATKRCAGCQHFAADDALGVYDCDRGVYHSLRALPAADFGCTLFASWTPER